MEIPLFFLSLLLLLPAASATSYLINCGAATNATDQGQDFTGDESLPTGVKLKLKGKSTTTSSSSSSSSNNSLYTTARVFTSDAAYQFDTNAAGTYLLRLHFLAFSTALTSARFSVSSNGHMLLPSFSGSQASISPVLKEFLIPIKTGETHLNLYFLPIVSAFVNAIEVIPADLNLTDINSPIMVTPQGGYNGSFEGGLGSRALEPLYRVNVGGSNVSASDDTLRRSWWQDDSYLVAGKEIMTKFGPKSVTWRDQNSTQTDAPREVYDTARGWNASSASTMMNATWSFSMSKDSTYFVRAHFCDIVSLSGGEVVFNLYFFSKFMWEVDAFNVAPEEHAPFCLDFVVNSDELGFINLTIGSIQDRGGAFLNGLEIMEFVNGSAIEPNIPSNDNNRHVVLIACVVAGGFALILILVAGFVWFMMRKRKRARPAEEFDWPLAILNGGGGGGGSSESKTTSDKTNSRSTLSSLPSLHLRIPLGVIQQVTSSFDEALIIGQGGFGKVYKGVLKNGQNVAVKRSDSRHGQGLPEFQTEITVLSKIRHRHLVSLIGYCDEESEMILVYEFMEKGTLRDHLYGAQVVHGEGLTWKQRLDICIGAAKGLHYLHTGSTGGIIHRDVKSTNILLDENFVAKVADFGLSRTGALDQDTHVSTVVKGTFGYLDPEYFQCMQLTEKSDVYSFGVLLLEVLCARLVLDTSRPRDEVNLADWAMCCKERGEVEMIVDKSLVGKVNNPNSLNKFVEAAEKCLKESGSDRPPMSDVLWDLEYALQLERFGGQGVVGFGDPTTTNEASFNLPMLDVPGFSSTAFSMQEEGGFGLSNVDDDVSGLCGESGQVSMTHSKTQ